MLQYKCDDQGGPQPKPPGGWKPGDPTPYDPKEDKKDDEQEHPATA